MSIAKRISLKRSVSLPSGSIRLAQVIDIALKNLFYKKLRTTLTVMGVVIGVGAVLFLLAFGFGLRDVVVGQVIDSNSVRTVDVSPAKANLVTLDEENQKRIGETPGVTYVAPVYFEAGTLSYNNAKTETVIYGTSTKYQDLISFTKTAGKLSDYKSLDSVVVNNAYIKALGIGSPEEILGKNLDYTASVIIDVDGKKEKKEISGSSIVQGVIETGSGAELYVAEEFFTAAGVSEASQLKVLVDNKEGVPSVQTKIETLGFTTSSPLQTLEQINQIFAFLNLLFLGFGSIGLIIAILGMFNTLTISLLERTAEIGLMITLGARRKDIRKLFMVEAVGLSLIGGVVGVIVAYGLSRIGDLILNAMARSRGVTESFSVFTFKPLLILGVLVSSALLGLLVVYFPAKRAANTNPIEALKT